jgi:adenylate cyclase
VAALKRHREAVFDPAVAAHNGRIVKLIGDGVIAEFGSVVDAVSCALSVQRSNATTPDKSASQPTIVLRIGINLGDVIIEGDDIYGDGVNVAARLEPLAEPGGICVSSIVNESVGNRIDVRFQDGGEISVKNIDRPIRVWKWHPSATTSAISRICRQTGAERRGCVDRRFAVHQHVRRPRTGVLLGRYQRRHHHRFIENRGSDGDRAQLEFHL